MSNGKGNPRTNYDISNHGAKVIRDTIKKNFKSDIFPDFKNEYISVSFDPSTDLDPKNIHFWVGKSGEKEIPDTEVLLGIWDHGYQLYSMDSLLMSGMNFTKESIDRPERYLGNKSSMASFKESKDRINSFKESIDRPERYLGKKGDLLDAFEGYILNHDEMVGAYKFNIIKYVTRFVEKNGIEDLDKADVYIKRLKKFLKEEEA